MSSGPERRRSLEQALQLALGGVVLLVLLALALGGILAVRNLASDFVTTRLEHDAEALVAMLDPQQQRFTRAVPPIYNQPLSGHYYAVLFDDGSMLRSRSLWDEALNVGRMTAGDMRIAMIEGPQAQQLLMLGLVRGWISRKDADAAADAYWDARVVKVLEEVAA